MTPPIDASRVILVGEANPYGADPRYALYFEPPQSAGGRLCKVVLGMTGREYLRTFHRVNLCPSKWSAPVARARAGELMALHAPIVLLGAKVCDAFGVEFDPVRTSMFADTGEPYVVIPHPSGLSRGWNQPGMHDKAKEAIMRLVQVHAQLRTAP